MEPFKIKENVFGQKPYFIKRLSGRGVLTTLWLPSRIHVRDCGHPRVILGMTPYRMDFHKNLELTDELQLMPRIYVVIGQPTLEILTLDYP